MRHKPKTKPQQAMTRHATLGGPAAFGAPSPVVIVREGNVVSVVMDWAQLDPAPFTLAADVARACMRNGQPELQFAQVDPFAEEPLASRLLIARYPKENFLDRARESLGFHQKLGPAPSYKPLAFPKGAAPGAPPPVQVDVDMEVLIRTGERAAVVFARTDAWNRHALVRGDAVTPNYQAVVEVTMSLPMMWQFLDSWSALAQELSR